MTTLTLDSLRERVRAGAYNPHLVRTGDDLDDAVANLADLGDTQDQFRRDLAYALRGSHPELALHEATSITTFAFIHAEPGYLNVIGAARDFVTLATQLGWRRA